MLPWRTFCCWSLTGGLWAIILFLEHFVSDSASTMSRTGTLLAIYLQVARLSLAIGLVGVIYGRRSTFSRVLFRWPWEGWTWALSCVLFLPLSLTWFSGGQKSMSADGKRTRFGSSANWLVAIEDPLPCTNSPKSNGRVGGRTIQRVPACESIQRSRNSSASTQVSNRPWTTGVYAEDLRHKRDDNIFHNFSPVCLKSCLINQRRSKRRNYVSNRRRCR